MHDAEHVAPPAHTSSARHAHYANHVLYKIKRAYGLDENAAVPPLPLQREINTRATAILNDLRWDARVSDSCRAEGASAPSRADLQRTAMAIIQRYANAFHLRAKIDYMPRSHVPTGPFYAGHRVRGNLLDIYTNHLTNQSECALQELGFSTRSAHALNGYLIGQTVRFCGAMSSRSMSPVVEPQQGSGGGCTDQEIQARVNTLRGYWKPIANDLSLRHTQARNFQERTQRPNDEPAITI